MNRFKKWLIPVVLVCLLLATLVGCSSTPASLGEIFDPSGNPFANRFSDVKDIRTATFVVAASDSEHKYEADYRCSGTNDHVQIQAAIDALPATGGEVFLLDGTYNIEVALVMDSYQTLGGCGRNTILTTTTADVDIITAIGGAGTEKVGILIADLCVDGAAGGAANDMGISFSYVDDSKIRNTWILNNQETGINLSNCDYIDISGNLVSDNNWSGVYVEICAYCTIVDNIGRASGFQGISLYYSTNSTITGNTCEGNTWSGINVESCSHCAIGDNTSQRNGNHGIRINTSSYCTITGNVCKSNVMDGISGYLATEDVFSSNICQFNGDNGMGMEFIDDCNIVGNICIDNSQVADDTTDNIRIDHCDRNLIVANSTRATTLGTTLTDGEPIGETEIVVLNLTGFYVGMGVVIDLGGVNEEYHWINALDPGAVAIIIDAPLANVQAIGENIDVPEAQYGIHVVGVTDTDNIIQGNDVYGGGKTANLNNLGTCTIVRDDNRDITPVQVKHLIYVQNTSGGNLLIGNIVSYEGAAGTIGFETPTAIGDPQVWGMLAEDIDDAAYGYIQVLGGTTVMDATNVGGGAIAIGDLLCTEVGSRARKAAAGHVTFAIALEALDAADGIIDVLIITPRMM